MTPRISDASDIAPWPLWIWLLVAAFLATAAIVHALRSAPLQDAEPSRFDTLDGVRQCHLRCGLRGTIERTTRPDLGGETVRVCPGHSDEGDRADRGWWA